MSEFLKEREAKFLRFWEKRRHHKRRIYIQYTLLWGLITGSLVYLFQISFRLSDFVFAQFPERFFLWLVVGLIWTHLFVRSQEKHYKKLTEQKES